jgi:NAD(P)-dependent dehydrogenase (short-subunit alcohol dehydrogenase family)
MRDLKANDSNLLDLSVSYRNCIADNGARIRHLVYYETEGIWGAKPVNAVSADPGITGVRPVPVGRDHIAICKVPSRTDEVYEGVSAFLEDEVLAPRPPTQNEKIDELLGIARQGGVFLRAEQEGISEHADPQKPGSSNRRGQRPCCPEDRASVVRLSMDAGRHGRALWRAGMCSSTMPARLAAPKPLLCMKPRQRSSTAFLNVNLRAVIRLSAAVLPPMLERRRGVILNIASVAGLVSFPARAAYSISKAAVIQVTRAIAADYGHLGIRSVALCPGMIETPMTHWRLSQPKLREEVLARIPQRTIGAVSDIVGAVAFFASDEARYCNDAAIAIDGGYSAI